MEAEKMIERANKAVTDAFNNGSEFERKRLIEKLKSWLELNTDWNKEYIREESPVTCWYRNVHNPNYGKIDELVKYLEE